MNNLSSTEAIFFAALETSAEERAAFLDQACGQDAELRRHVERLLNAHPKVGSFLRSPAANLCTLDELAIAECSGSVIGPYRLLQQIGEGGFGVVYMAEQLEPVRRKVAIKIIKPGMDTKEVIARFESERQALALMDHPNIACVLDAGATESGRPYFVMELVRGVPITEYCDKNNLSAEGRLGLFVTVCHAVQHAHQKGVIHRDIKPTNIMVTMHDGVPVPKVIDFGVAKATSHQLTQRTLFTSYGQMIGTPAYMSPEQAEMSGLDVDTRSDIYSLGVLLYELLTGTTPLEKKRLAQAAYDEIRRLIREEEPPKPSTRLSTSESIVSIAAQRQTEPARLPKLVRGDLDWITMKCLEKDRTRRYETANGLARDIQRFLADEAVEACPPSATYRLRKFARKNRAVLTTAATMVLLLAAGTTITTWQALRATRAERAALAAQRAETERAEGERRAKLDAETQREAALRAAIAEKTAKEQAQKRLAQIEKGNDIITAIFIDLDVNAVKQESEPLEAVFAKRLVKAAEQLEGESVGAPLVVAGLQDRLGRSLLSLGYAQSAIPLLVKARATRASELGADHPDTLTSMGNLAWSYSASGKPDLALPLLQETLKLTKSKRGADHPSTLACMNNLAEGYRLAGELDLALPLLEETLNLSTAKLGAYHPNTLRTMSNLASGYKAAGKLDLALPLLEDTVKLKKARLGADHPDTVTCMNNLASGYQAAGKLDLALSLFEDTVKVSKARLGADHPNTLICMYNLASGYQAAGKLELALPLYEETLKLQTAKHGTDHPDTLTSMASLAAGYRDAGKLDLAISLSQMAAAGIERRRFQHEHAGLIITNLSAYYEQLEQFDQAEAWRRKWLAVVRERAGADSTAYASELAQVGLNLLRQRRWTEAETALKECLAIREEKELDDWRTFNTKSLLGGALLGQKKYAHAEPLLISGYEGMKAREESIAKVPLTAMRIPEALDRLVELYTALENPDEVERWQSERAKYAAGNTTVPEQK